MRVVFFGTSPFAVPSLTALLKAHTVLAVVTQPDRPHGRGGKVASSPVKEAAAQAGLPLLQPEKVRTREFRETVQGLQPDVLVVAAFGQIISQRLLDSAPLGGLNVHGSLLPRWRGAAPMQYALMAGDAETGVTVMQMDAGLDTGDILTQAALPLTTVENWGALEGPLAQLGARLLLETLTLLEQGTCPRVPQEAALVTLAPSLPPDAGRLNWERAASELHNLVRGVTPRPGAYTLWQGKRLKVWRTSIVYADPPAAPGVVQNIGSHGIMVGTGVGTLRLVEVQPESKGRMAAGDWARGARANAGQCLGEDAPPE